MIDDGTDYDVEIGIMAKWHAELGSGEDASGVHKRCHRCSCSSVVMLVCAVKIAMFPGSFRYWNGMGLKKKGSDCFKILHHHRGVETHPPKIVGERVGRVIPLFIMLSAWYTSEEREKQCFDSTTIG